MEEALVKTLKSFEIGEPVSRGPLHLFPLVGGPDEKDGPALLAEALEGGSLLVEEVGEEGSVPELCVVNRKGVRVLILEGDELVGAKQDRTVNSTVLVAAATNGLDHTQDTRSRSHDRKAGGCAKTRRGTKEDRSDDQRYKRLLGWFKP